MNIYYLLIVINKNYTWLQFVSNEISIITILIDW